MKYKHFILILGIFAFALMVYGLVKDTPFVEKSECVGCGDCERVCPTRAVSLDDGRATIDPDKCIDCLFCVKSCTYGAIRRPK